MKQFMCGTPTDNCKGSFKAVSSGMRFVRGRDSVKLHESSEEAFNCHRRYLLSQGYKQVGSREFENPETHSILVLNKKSHYGARLRAGKSGTSGNKSKRYNPEKNKGGLVT